MKVFRNFADINLSSVVVFWLFTVNSLLFSINVCPHAVINMHDILREI